MKRTLNFVLCLSVFAMMSCGECEDKTLEVSDNLIDFINYDQQTSITMVNGAGETKSFTVISDVDVDNDEDGDCTTTSVKPFFTLNTTTQDAFIRIWVSLNEDFVLGDHEQLWFVIDEDDEDIFESGMLREPLFNVASVNLNGTNFDEVISLSRTDDQNVTTAIHVQRNVGIVGYELMGETWVLQ